MNCSIKSQQPGGVSRGFPGFSQVQQEIQAREEMLQPLYTQVACEFADLHDRAGRMKAVGAIKESTLDFVLMHVLAKMNLYEHYVSLVFTGKVWDDVFVSCTPFFCIL